MGGESIGGVLKDSAGELMESDSRLGRDIGLDSVGEGGGESVNEGERVRRGEYHFKLERFDEEERVERTEVIRDSWSSCSGREREK